MKKTVYVGYDMPRPYEPRDLSGGMRWPLRWSGEFLRATMTHNGMTPKEVADRAGMSVAEVEWAMGGAPIDQDQADRLEKSTGIGSGLLWITSQRGNVMATKFGPVPVEMQNQPEQGTAVSPVSWFLKSRTGVALVSSVLTMLSALSLQLLPDSTPPAVRAAVERAPQAVAAVAQVLDAAAAGDPAEAVVSLDGATLTMRVVIDIPTSVPTTQP